MSDNTRKVGQIRPFYPSVTPEKTRMGGQLRPLYEVAGHTMNIREHEKPNKKFGYSQDYAPASIPWRIPMNSSDVSVWW